MTTKFVASVIAMRFLSSPPQLATPVEKKSLLSRRKNPRELMFAEEES